MQLGNKDSAMDDFALAVDLDANNADIYHHRGQVLIIMYLYEHYRVSVIETYFGRICI